MKLLLLTPDLLGPASMFLGRVIGLPSSPLRTVSQVVYLFFSERENHHL